MAELTVRSVHKAFGSTRALAGASLSVAAGTLAAVLGPSGCGKTTLLRCVAGFERVDAGEIEVGGRAVTKLPPHRRAIAVVPQEAALFPHLSVFDNVAYGISRPAGRAERVSEVLSLVGLSGYECRMPHQLSGGQQQRVAVARALAPRPPLVLLDEPFSALDATLRVELRRDVRQALRADGATAVLVTHDQGEALSMADQIAVMRDGEIIQSGPPLLVYSAPADAWVASFVGEAVLLPASVDGGVARTALGDLSMAAPGSGPGSGSGSGSGSGVVLVRPEQLDLLPAGATEGVAATVVRHDYHGHDSLVSLSLADGTPVASRVLGSAASAIGATTVGAAVRVRVHGDARPLAHPDLG